MCTNRETTPWNLVRSFRQSNIRIYIIMIIRKHTLPFTICYSFLKKYSVKNGNNSFKERMSLRSTMKIWLPVWHYDRLLSIKVCSNNIYNVNSSKLYIHALTKRLIHLYIASNFLCIPIACNLLFSKVTHTKNDCTKKGYHKIIGNLTSKEHKQNNDQKKKSNTPNNGL
jgi:hypothetical protein